MAVRKETANAVAAGMGVVYSICGRKCARSMSAKEWSVRILFLLGCNIGVVSSTRPIRPELTLLRPQPSSERLR